MTGRPAAAAAAQSCPALGDEPDVGVPRDDASSPNRLRRPVILTPAVANGRAAAFPDMPADVGTTSAAGRVGGKQSIVKEAVGQIKAQGKENIAEFKAMLKESTG